MIRILTMDSHPTVLAGMDSHPTELAGLHPSELHRRLAAIAVQLAGAPVSAPEHRYRAVA